MKEFVNLLPFEYRRKQLLRRRVLQWSVVWAACAAVTLALWWAKQTRYVAALRAMETAQRSYRPVRQLAGECETMRAELDALHARGTVLKQLRDERPMLTLIGLASRSASRCQGRLVVREMLFQRDDRDAKGAPRKAKPPPKEPSQPETGEPPKWGSVTFKGDALDNLAVAAFVVGLRDSGLFRRVELKSSLGKNSEKTKLRSYLVECDI